MIGDGSNWGTPELMKYNIMGMSFGIRHFLHFSWISTTVFAANPMINGIRW
jgi:hypothetical protein